MDSLECSLCWESPESAPDRPEDVPTPTRGPVAARVAGHALVEHLLGGEAATPVGAVGGPVAADAMHVSGGRAGERLVADRAVLQLHPGDPVTTGPAGPSHDCSYVLIFQALSGPGGSIVPGRPCQAVSGNTAGADIACRGRAVCAGPCRVSAHLDGREPLFLPPYPPPSPPRVRARNDECFWGLRAPGEVAAPPLGGAAILIPVGPRGHPQ